MVNGVVWHWQLLVLLAAIWFAFTRLRAGFDAGIFLFSVTFLTFFARPSFRWCMNVFGRPAHWTEELTLGVALGSLWCLTLAAATYGTLLVIKVMGGS